MVFSGGKVEISPRFDVIISEAMQACAELSSDQVIGSKISGANARLTVCRNRNFFNE